MRTHALDSLSFATARRACLPLARIGCAALALAAGSQLQLPLWMTPVPLTAQPQVVLMMAALLGPAEASMALASWWAAAAAGYPVLAHGASGAALLGPTGGFLLSYVPVVALVGRWGRGRDARAFAVWQLAGLVTLGCGVIGLCAFVGPRAAVALGFTPFWLADLMKVTAAFLILRFVPGRWRRRRRLSAR